jgi:hypothetical protein
MTKVRASHTDNLATRTAVGFFKECIFQSVSGGSRRRFHAVRAYITVILFAPPLLLLPSVPVHGQETYVAQSVQGGSSPRRGAAHRVPSNRKSAKSGKASNKRDIESKESSDRQNANDLTSGPTRDQDQDRYPTDDVGNETTDDGNTGAAKLHNERSVTTGNGKRKFDTVRAIMGSTKAGAEPPGANAAAQYSRRLEFDARLVYGETAGSGAVILFERGQRQLPPLTEQRKKFLTATIESVLGKKREPSPNALNTIKGAELDETENRSTVNGSRN